MIHLLEFWAISSIPTCDGCLGCVKGLQWLPQCAYAASRSCAQCLWSDVSWTRSLAWIFRSGKFQTSRVTFLCIFVLAGTASTAYTHTHTPWKPKKSSSPSAKICQRVRPVRLMFHTFDSWSGGECYFPSSCLRGQGPNCRCSCWFDTPRITGAPNLNTDPIGPSQRKEFLDARPVIRQSWTFVSLHKLFVAQLDFGWVRWVMLGENSCVKTGGSSTPEC